MSMERFGHVIRDAIQEGRWKCIKTLRIGPPIPHLFLDDLVSFMGASYQRIDILKSCLKLFCDASRES